MKKPKYEILEIGIISFFVTRASIILGLFEILSDLAKEDAILSVIFGTLIGSTIVLGWAFIKKLTPNLNFIDKIDNVYKRWLGGILKIILVCSMILLASYLLNRISLYINYNLLDKANLFLIAGTFIIISLYLAQKGLLTIVRTADIFIYLIIFLTIVSIFLLIPYFEISNLKPFYTHNNLNILTGSLIFAGLTTSPLFLINIIKIEEINYHRHYYKSTIINYLISSFIILMIFILTNGILGINLATFYRYPYLIIFSKISFFNFIEHIEPIFAISYLFDGLILMSMILVYIKEIFQRTFRRVKKKITNYFMYLVAFFIFVGSYYSNTFSIVIYFCIMLISTIILSGFTNLIYLFKKN